MSGLTCCCSIVSVVCIWYIDFLPPHCLGSLAIILVGMSTVSVGNVCFHTWLTSPMLRIHTLSDVVNRVFLSVMSQMLNFFLTVSISWDNMWHHKTTCLAVRMAIVKKWRVTNAMGEDSNATYDKPMEPACVTYPSISEQPDVRMLKPRGRETESIWTSGETIKGTLGKPRHPLFNFVFGVESFQSLEVCGCGAAHRSRKYVRCWQHLDGIWCSEIRQIGFREICANTQLRKQWTNYKL